MMLLFNERFFQTKPNFSRTYPTLSRVKGQNPCIRKIGHVNIQK